MKEFLRKHKKLIIFLVILLIIGGIVLFIRNSIKKSQEMLSSMMNTFETATVERRSLVDSLAATGMIVSIDKKDVYANVTNVEVTEVNFEVGDEIHEGDLICVMDSSRIEDSMKTTRTTYDSTKGQSNVNVNAASRALDEAQTDKSIDMQRARQDVDWAYGDYLKAVTDMETAESDWHKAEETYYEKKGELEGAEERGDQAAVMTWQTKVSAAETAKDAAKKAYDASVTSADTYYRTYVQKLRILEDYDRDDDSIILNKNDSLYNQQISNNAAGVSEQAQIRSYKDQIAECTVYAPMDGVVTAVNVEEGKVYSGASIITIEDASSYEIEAEIDEYDITKVEAGQRVIFKTNGTGDKEFEGRVREIAPKATRNAQGALGNNVTYKVKISIDSPASELKMDMTAKLSIILNSRNNVLTVPYDALQVDEDGAYYVESVEEEKLEEITYDTADAEKDNMRNDQTGQQNQQPETRKIFVEKGLESDYYVQVISDEVKEGMSVVVPSSHDAMDDFVQLLQEQGAMGGF